MKTAFITIFASLSVTGMAHADLNHPVYVEAKAAYASNDCGSAVPLLVRYSKVDAEFLRSHADDAKKIETAIATCRVRLNHTESRFVGISASGHVANPRLIQNGDAIESVQDRSQILVNPAHATRPGSVSLNTR